MFMNRLLAGLLISLNVTNLDWLERVHDSRWKVRRIYQFRAIFHSFGLLQLIGTAVTAEVEMCEN